MLPAFVDSKGNVKIHSSDIHQASGAESPTDQQPNIPFLHILSTTGGKLRLISPTFIEQGGWKAPPANNLAIPFLRILSTTMKKNEVYSSEVHGARGPESPTDQLDIHTFRHVSTIM